MNENIQKLINRSFTGCQGEQFDPEKFALLIVRECAKIANDNFNKGFCPVGHYIKQHFGVTDV